MTSMTRLRITQLCICVWLAALAPAQSFNVAAFEVASVRRHVSPADVPVYRNLGVNPIRISGNRVELQMLTLKGLVMAAYDVKEYQISGGPGWLASLDQTYDVAAKSPGSATTTMAGARLMLQTLLAERFRLTLRRESKELPVYNLVLGRGKLKLREVPAESALTPGMARATLEQITAQRGFLLDRPLIDKTGLTGTYEYSPLLESGSTSHIPDQAEVIADEFRLLEDMLGLKALPAKATIEMLVIEGAEKPSEN